MEKDNKNNIQIETKKNDLKPESNIGLVSIGIKNIFVILGRI